MIRLIACDIDGTLLQNGETRVSDRFFREARRLMERGIAVCPASGRQYSSLRRLFAPMQKELYFLCENGAAVFGPGDPGPLLSKTVMDRALSLALCRQILEQPDCEVLVSGTNTSYLCPKDPDFADRIRFFVGNNTTVLPSLEAIPEDIIKISAYCPKGADTLEPILAPAWREHFQVAIAGPSWLDFTLADKGTGIRALCRELNISADEVMVFGDNYNDIPMLEAAGHPYLMASAAPALRQRFPMQCCRPEDILEQL